MDFSGGAGANFRIWRVFVDANSYLNHPSSTRYSSPSTLSAASSVASSSTFYSHSRSTSSRTSSTRSGSSSTGSGSSSSSHSHSSSISTNYHTEKDYSMVLWQLLLICGLLLLIGALLIAVLLVLLRVQRKYPSNILSLQPSKTSANNYNRMA